MTITIPEYLIIWLSCSMIIYSVAKCVDIMLEIRLRRKIKEKERQAKTTFIDCISRNGG